MYSQLIKTESKTISIQFDNFGWFTNCQNVFMQE
jgi:hypothetical protein